MRFRMLAGLLIGMTLMSRVGTAAAQQPAPPIIMPGDGFSGDTIARDQCLTIAVGPSAAAECGDLRIVHALPSIRRYNTVRTPMLVYSSAEADPRPIVAANVTLQSGAATLQRVAATLYVEGVPRAEGVWKGASWPAGTARIALQYRAFNEPSGSYRYQLFVTAHYASGESETSEMRGRLAVVNRSTSPFGAGWWLSGLEQLLTSPSGTPTAWIGGDGSFRTLVQVDSTTLAAPSIDRPDTLKLVSGEWNRLVRGAQIVFDQAGRESIARDRTGHETRFYYDLLGRLRYLVIAGPESDSTSRTYLWSYGGDGHLASVLLPGPDGPLFVTFQFGSGNRVLAMTGPDTTGVTFGYTGPGAARITSRSDRTHQPTSYRYAASGKLSGSRRDAAAADSIVIGLQTAESVGLPNADGTSATDTARVYTLYDGPRYDAADTITFRIDNLGAPRQIADAYGIRTTLTRAQREFPGLVTAVQQGANGLLTTAHYTAFGNPDSVVDHDPLDNPALGDAITRYTWIEPWDEVTKIVRPEHDSTMFGYDAYGNRIWEQDGPDAAHTTRFAYDPTSHQLASVSPPGAPSAVVSYDTHGNLASWRTPSGLTTIQLNDALGRVTEIDSPISVASGFDSATVYHSGLVHQFQYDLLDRVTADITLTPRDTSVSSDFAYIGTSYDNDGRVLAVTRFTGIDSAQVHAVTNRYRYDLAGRRVADIAPDGAIDSTLFDPAGNPVQVITRRGDTLTMRYDARSRLTARLIPEVRYIRFFDGLGNIELGPSGRRHGYPWYANAADSTDSLLVIPADSELFAYDSLDRLTRADNSDALVRRAYFPNGLLKSERLIIGTYASRDTTQHVYDTSVEYDLDGRRTAFHQPAQLTTVVGVPTDAVRFQYDSIGQLAHVTGLMNEAYDALYDLRGNRIRLSLPGGLRDSSSYDVDDRLQHSWMFNAVTTGNHFADPVLRNTTLSYDGADRVVIGHNAVELADSVWNSYTVFGQLARRELHEKTLALVTQDTAALHVVERFSWDALAHLGLTHDSGSVQYKYHLDNNSPSSEGYYYLANADGSGTGRLGMQTRGTPIDSLRYDAEGNLVFRFTENCGSNTPRMDRALFYDAEQRLRVSEVRGTPESFEGCDMHEVGTWTDQFEEYRYDALGRRILNRFRTNCEIGHQRPVCGVSVPAIQRTVWDGSQEAAEIRMPGADEDSSWWENDTQQVHIPFDTVANGQPADATPNYGHVLYVQAPVLTAIDEPLALVRVHYGDTLWTTHEFTAYPPTAFVPHWDWKGNADMGTVSDGTVEVCLGSDVACNVPHWRRRAYAFLQEQDASDSRWYGSLLIDHEDESGMPYRRNRYVDLLSNQFTQEDPIGVAGGVNLYGFAAGDPVNHSDPFGLCPPEWLCKLANFSAGFGDAVTFRLTNAVRNAIDANDVVDKSSGAYLGGAVTGTAASIALGGAAARGAAAAGEASFFEGTSYSGKVLGQMSKGAGEFHSFPESVRAFESAGTVRTVKGGDGVVRQVLEIPGSYRTAGGKLVDGVFQFLKEADGTINHRLFVPR